MAEVDLKRCPFCGGEAEVTLFLGNYIVACKGCPGSTFPCKGMTEEEAVEAWNRRADDDLYKKGYKDGWNSCVKDRADGWMIDYI